MINKPHKLKHSINGLLLIVFASMLVFGFADNVRGAIFPQLIDQFHLNHLQASLFFLFTSGFGLLINLLASRWLSWWGTQRSLFYFLWAQGFGLLLVSYADQLVMVYVGAAIFGLGVGGLGIAQNILIGENSPREQWDQMYSLLHSLYGMASLLAPCVATWTIFAGLYWQRIFFILALLSFFVASFLFFYLRTSGNDAAIVSNASCPDPTKDQSPQSTGAHEQKTSMRALIWVSMLITAYVMSELLVSTRLVLLAIEEFHYPEAQSKLVLSLFFVLLLSGRLYFSLRRSQQSTSHSSGSRSPIRRLLIVSALCSFICLVFGLFAHGGPVVIAIAGLFMAPFYPLAMSFIRQSFGDSSDRAISWSFTGVSIGLILMNLILGYLSDQIGLISAMGLGPFCLFVVMLLLLNPPSQFALKQKKLN